MVLPRETGDRLVGAPLHVSVAPGGSHEFVVFESREEARRKKLNELPPQPHLSKGCHSLIAVDFIVRQLTGKDIWSMNKKVLNST
jgi:hypothetical protein